MQMNSTITGVCATSMQRAVAPQFYAGLMTLLVALLGYQSIVLLRPGRATRKFQMDYTLALRTAPLLLAQTLPLLVPVWRRSLPNSFVQQYGWLPFWYVFTLATTYGGFCRLARDAILGVVVALLGSHLMNWLMPGGAGPLARQGSGFFDPDFAKWTLWPGGYSPLVATIYASCFAYLVFLLPFSTDTKRFCMGAFASDIVTFMNPDQPAYAFYAVLYDYSFRWNFVGPAISLFWVVLISVSLSGLSLVPRPKFAGMSWNRSALAQTSADCAGLALDSGGTLRLLLAYYCQGASEFELEGISSYIETMKKIKKSVDAEIDAVRWEILIAHREIRLSHLQWLSVLIERLHIILQFLLVQIRVHQESGGVESDISCIASNLDTFLSCVDVLGEIASPEFPQVVSSDTQLLNECLQACADADDVLKAAIWTLAQQSVVNVDQEDGSDPYPSLRNLITRVDGFPEHALPFAETAFLDTLREWVALLRRFVDGPPREDLENKRVGEPLHSAENVRSAFRNTMSWVMALLYCVYFGNYSSTCIVTVSFIFSKNLAALWDRNLNRLIGVTLSTVLGNLPAYFCLGGCAYDPEQTLWSEIYTYLLMMFCIWLMSVYTYLEGGRWSYAFSLVAGLGGDHMLNPLGITSDRGNWQMVDYNNLADTSMALIITFAVDLLFCWIFRLGCLHLVAESVSDTIEVAGLMLDDFIAGNLWTFDAPDLRERADLKTKGKLRRQFHEKVATLRRVHQEACMKESAWHVPYKAHLVDSLISQFDIINAATYSICTSVERCNSGIRLSAILQRCVPPRLPHLIRGYARCAKQALSQKTHEDAWSLDCHLCGNSDSIVSLASLRRTSTHSAHSQLLCADSPSSHLLARSVSESSLTDLFQWQSDHGASPRDPKRFSIVWQDLSNPLRESGLLVLDSSGLLRMESAEVACEAAATFAVICGVLGLRLCFDKIENMLRDEEFMCFGHWGFSPNSALERLRYHTVDKGHFVRPSTRKQIVLPSADESLA